MKKKLKKTLFIVGGILLFFLLIAAIVSLLFFYNKPLIKGIVEKQIEKRTGIHTVIGEMDYELFPLRIEAGPIEFSTFMDETKVDVFIEKLVLEGDFHRIRKKKKPYFDSVEAEGIRVISHIEESRKKMTIQDIFDDLSSSLNYVREIRLKNSFFEFLFPEKRLTLQGVDIALSPEDANQTFSFTLFCRNVEGNDRAQTNSFQNTIQASGTLSLKEKPTLEGKFVLTSNNLTYAGKKQFFDEVHLNFAGEFHKDKNAFNFPSLEIEIPSFVSLTGPLEIAIQDELTLFFRPHLNIDDLGRVFFLAKDRLPHRFDTMLLEGSALFAGEARITPAHPEQQANITGHAILNPSRIEYSESDYRFDGLVSGSLDIDNFPENQDVSGSLKITAGAFNGKNLEASGMKTGVPFVYDHKGARIDIPSITASASSLSLDIPNRKFKSDSPRFSGKVSIDLEKRSLRISGANIELRPFPPFEFEAQAGFNPLTPNSISAKCSRIGFDTLMDFFDFAVPQKVIDWEPEGWMNIQIEARDRLIEKQKVLELSARMEVNEVSFHDPAFTIAGESLRPNLTLKGTFGQNLDVIGFAAKIELSQGESLWRDFYVDWSKIPLLGTISGQYHVSQKRLTDLAMDAAIPEFGRITAKGSLDLSESRSAELKVTASALQLSPLYAFIDQKRGGSLPSITLKGEAEGNFDAKIDRNAFSIAGYLKVKNASWSDEGIDLSVQGIEAYIPFQYEKNATNPKREAVHPEKGYLTFQKFRSPYTELSAVRLDISSVKNGHTIQPFKLDIFGQKAEVGRTSIEYGASSADFMARTSFNVKDGDLSKLPFTSQDFHMEGGISVDLPVVEIFPEHITTEGRGNAHVFGGEIAVENIRVDQPFSKSRTISADLTLSGLDLEKITDTIPFGRVTGIINGEIQDLAFSYGQPERFNIRLESEKRKGISQRFSLKATNDLAILGTGEKTPFSPQSGWTRFVKEFRYKKIGIACSLKNDIFSLSGTIHKKGVEYLVKGSGVFAINVVNKQTRNQIQFKDMLSRLKRIGQSQQSR